MMNRIGTPHVLLIAFVLMACSDRPQPRPILSAEYDIYAQFIAHTASREAHGRSARFQVFVFDSTKDITVNRHPTTYQETIIKRGGTILFLLESCPDTIQLAAIEEDYSRNNRRQCFINVDSLRIRLDSGLTTIAETRSVLAEGSCTLRFSRIAFNPTLDQAMVKVKYGNIFGYIASDVYFVRKQGRWQFVEEVQQQSVTF